uniref:Secreted protein n=1 Tax=Steinernema glaseri TaxID=37863 RepID=A0A1I8AI42_9BILA
MINRALQSFSTVLIGQQTWSIAVTASLMVSQRCSLKRESRCFGSGWIGRLFELSFRLSRAVSRRLRRTKVCKTLISQTFQPFSFALFRVAFTISVCSLVGRSQQSFRTIALVY